MKEIENTILTTAKMLSKWLVFSNLVCFCFNSCLANWDVSCRSCTWLSSLFFYSFQSLKSFSLFYSSKSWFFFCSFSKSCCAWSNNWWSLSIAHFATTALNILKSWLAICRFWALRKRSILSLRSTRRHALRVYTILPKIASQQRATVYTKRKACIDSAFELTLKLKMTSSFFDFQCSALTANFYAQRSSVSLKICQLLNLLICFLLVKKFCNSIMFTPFKKQKALKLVLAFSIHNISPTFHKKIKIKTKSVLSTCWLLTFE